MTRHSRSAGQTQAIAARLARTLAAGQCLGLHGELGAGKTQFVRGLVDGLGGQPRRVTSPTFVLLNVYPTPAMTVYHLDAYRVGGSRDFEGIGFSELLDQGGLVVVEWAERVADLMPQRSLHVRIEIVDAHRRLISIGPVAED